MRLHEEKDSRTWRRRERGRHSLKALLDKKDWKKAGQLDAVKLFPILESNGLGRADVSVVEEAIDVPVAVDTEESCARLIKRTAGGGGGL